MISQPPASHRVLIIDTTLRDGAQTPGLAFSREQKMTIAGLLDAIGVDELEAGTPVMGSAERGDIRALSAMGLNCRIVGWCRAHGEDVRRARHCGLDGIHIGIPVSDIQLSAMGKDRSWVMKQLKEIVAVAAGEFEQVSVGAQDATRTHPDFLAAVASAAAEAGACRFRLADTVGVAHPLQAAALVAQLKRAAPGVPIEFHAHNDLGMATANAVSAAAAGADALSVTVNGLGERAGNAVLAEVATALWRCHAGLTGIRLEALTSLSRLVAYCCGASLPPQQPLVGDLVFTHESGIHCDGMLKDSATFEPFAPECVGQAAFRLVAGTHSGSSGIRGMLARLGYRVDARAAEMLRPAVQRAARDKQGPLSDDDLIAIYRRSVPSVHEPTEKPFENEH